MSRKICLIMHFFFNDTATTEIYTLSLHDALPISLHTSMVIFTRRRDMEMQPRLDYGKIVQGIGRAMSDFAVVRSEEHTSELQSHLNTLFRLLLEKKIRRTSRQVKNPFTVHGTHDL